MQTLDMNGRYPAAANSIEIRLSTDPAAAVVDLYRAPDDRTPIRMVDGASTIIGTPADARLYAQPVDEAVRCSLEIVAWFP